MKVAVVGASGYAGRELCALLAAHPALELAARMSARPGVEPGPPARELDALLEPLEPERFAGLDGVFLCAPHGAATELARAALAAGCRVVDLSADFRLKDPRAWREAYGGEHAAPELCQQSVYGLSERARAQIARAVLVANPGCYPTSILLPLLPLVEAGALRGGAPVIADSKSGVSGAGKAPSERTHYGNVAENLSAYGVGTHRHGAEIAQEAGGTQVVFVPHLLPCFRGILSTLYLSPAAGVGAAEVRAILREAYLGEPFVRVLERDLPDLDGVRHTNECHLGVADAGGAGGLVVVVSALDNLVKGAAGQALQNMNLALGLEETLGLPRRRA